MTPPRPFLYPSEMLTEKLIPDDRPVAMLLHEALCAKNYNSPLCTCSLISFELISQETFWKRHTQALSQPSPPKEPQ